MRPASRQGMNDLLNGLASVTGGASGGVMLLAVFTSNEPPCAEWDRRWHTPSIDGVAAAVGICGSVVVGLLAALCSFHAVGNTCSLSYYWVLPLSNLTFALGVASCVAVRRCFGASLRSIGCGSRRGRPGGEVSCGATQTRLEFDGVELIRK